MDNQGTKTNLILSAIDLFSHRWYSDVSVANICRNAGLSNGVFYRYFRNKEEIFTFLVEDFLAYIEQQLGSVTGETIEERLEHFIHTLLRLTKEKSKQVSIFREGQYRFPEYERRLQTIYHATVDRVYDRHITEPEYLYILAGLRFIAYRSQFHHVAVDPEVIKAIILHGVFTLPLKEPESLFAQEVVPLSVAIEENTRDKLLKSGKALFGEKDFYRVNIHEITNQTGLAAGTFYKHFESKLAFFCEIIDQIGHDLRGFISKNLDRSHNRLTQEIQGIFLFCLYLTIDKSCYNIVREAEFVAGDTAKAYYDRFEQGYFNNLCETKHTDTRTMANFLIGIAHYLGIEMLLFQKGTKHVKDTLIELSRYLIDGIEA